MGVFERVVACGSFVGAAQDVGLSPSAVSKLITRLELRLGVRLINRTTRRLALTAEGQTLLERAREILGAIDAAESEIASARTTPRGHLRVLAPPVLAIDHLGPALPRFLARHPGVTLDFLITNRFVDLVRENVDIALRTGQLDELKPCRAKDRRYRPSHLRQSEVPRPPSPAGAILTSFMSDPQPHSRFGDLVVPD